MSILVNKNTKLLIQGITGRDGQFHAGRMQEYGTSVVAGTSPGKGGQVVHGIPVFNTVVEAVRETAANTSIIFVPAAFAADAALEASFAGIKLVVIISEGVPVSDMIRITPILAQNETYLIGPNCPGLITPDEALVGILPAMIFSSGSVGLMSRSGTLTYEVVNMLTEQNMGQSTVVGIGGDPIAGLYYQQLLEMYENDEQTKSIVLIGEIGGDAEEQAAEYIRKNVSKPVVAFIAGQAAPPGKRMGHAGAIISSGSGTAAEKIKAFAAAGVPVAKEPSEIPALLKQKLS